MSQPEGLFDRFLNLLGGDAAADVRAWVGRAEVRAFYNQVVNTVTQLWVVTPRRLIRWEQTSDRGQTQVLTISVENIRRTVYHELGQGEESRTARLLIEVEAENPEILFEAQATTGALVDEAGQPAGERTAASIGGVLRPVTYVVEAGSDRVADLKAFAQALANQL